MKNVVWKILIRPILRSIVFVSKPVGFLVERRVQLRWTRKALLTSIFLMDAILNAYERVWPEPVEKQTKAD